MAWNAKNDSTQFFLALIIMGEAAKNKVIQDRNTCRFNSFATTELTTSNQLKCLSKTN